MTEAEYLQQLAEVNERVNAQEARGKTIIAERDQAIVERDAAIAEKDAANTALAAANQELTDTNAGLVAHIAELDAIIADLKARPEVPESAVAKLQEVRDNLEDNFVA